MIWIALFISFYRWYPPGHGDFYQAFYNSDHLEDLINDGKKYVFLSNIDNLGATVDLGILKEIITEGSEFIMEVTDKTRADVKGGTLINYEGHLRLLEVAQVPKDHLEEFKSVKKFNVFNTNNLWISLDSIKTAVEERTLDMEVIGNFFWSFLYSVETFRIFLTVWKLQNFSVNQILCEIKVGAYVKTQELPF